MLSNNLETVKYDFWRTNESQEIESIDVTCFMPNGNCISMKCPPTYTMTQMKAELWEEAENYPLFGQLETKGNYKIKAIKSFSAVLEEIYDESQRIVDIQPFFAFFKIVRREVSDSADLKQNISILIGKKFDNYKNPEVNYFRTGVSKLSRRLCKERAGMKPKERIFCQNPPQVDELDIVIENLRKNDFIATINLLSEYNIESMTIEVNCNMIPDELLEKIVAKIQRIFGQSQNSVDELVLKVCGQEEYILGDQPMIKFTYIRECLERDETPIFVLLKVSNVVTDAELHCPLGRSCSSKNYHRLQSVKKLSSWELQENFKVTIQAINNLKIDGMKIVELRVRAGLFHGGRQLCESLETQAITIKSGEISGEWNKILYFDIKVCDIPRMARLCFVVYQIEKNGNQCVYKDWKIPICWVNTTIFDYKNQLKIDGQTLYTWVYVEFQDNDEMLLPLGTVEQNTNVQSCTTITIAFPNHIARTKFYYPCEIEICRQIKNKESPVQPQPLEKMIITTCEPFMHNDRIFGITKPERKTIWEMRYYCMNLLPNFLPYLLCCVEWNDRQNVSEVVNILNQWPRSKMSVEQILKLLDYTYADNSVRKFAVMFLKEASDEILQVYLLQLIQALKHELYLTCDLVELLLERASRNQRIGQYLFWYLRSEINVPSVEIRFTLILEAYLMISQEHVATLMKQHHFLEKFKLCNYECKRSTRDKTLSREKATEKLIKLLNTASTNEDLMNVISPLDPSIRWKRIIGDNAKIMDSKKQPILFYCENIDPYGREIKLIFKEGDDLRQDALILQMLKIMDRIWRASGLDLRLSIYNCLNMGQELGLIEPVGNSETVANIIRSTSSSMFLKKEALFEWLKVHNSTGELLEKAVNEFTLSCAGYCVATYVLGIADRHPNNIMIKTNGQMFHIDFGHILGNFKEKFGVKRERVGFVLTNDFIHVINRGKKREEIQREDFEKFQELCEKAFLILRRNGSLLLSLFSMMIQTGLPELSSVRDLDYLRETLVLDLSEEQALDFFRGKFDEALKGSWTSFNWFIHMLNRNNN